MHDLTLRGGTVYDGLGSEPITADVAIDGDRITAIGSDLGDTKRTIDCGGLAVAPGFIDPHTHSDCVPLMDDPQPFKLLQGVTTEIVGNCGASFGPMSSELAELGRPTVLSAGVEVEPGTFADYLDRIEASGPTNHIAALVGHGTLRSNANMIETTLREGALEDMCRLADEAFAAGAFGFSSGLIYVPGAYADVDELVAIGTVAQRWQRIYTTHMRDESRYLGEALDEAIEVARRAGIRLQVSHCKSAGHGSHGQASMLLDKLRAARRAGVDVKGDQYPYLAGSTVLSALLPPVAQEGGPDEFKRRLREERGRLKALADDDTIKTGAGLWREATPDDVLVVSHRDASNVGRTLADIAGGRDAWDVLCELLLADGASQMVVSLMDENDVREIMSDPLVVIGSDNLPPVGLQHPRAWGCFPRVLGEYVRDVGLIDLAEGIRKMTSATALQFGLVGRGTLLPGAIADVCVFDPQTIGHDGTYLEPDVKPSGVHHVVLAGAIVVEDGTFTGERRGHVLRAGHPEPAIG